MPKESMFKNSSRVFFWGMGLTVVAGGATAHGVVIADGNGTGNTTATGAFATAFSQVGTYGTIGTVVYLGNGVILTANHVVPAVNPGGAVVINGTSYNLVSGSKVQLHEPGNSSVLDDLAILKIDISGGAPGAGVPLGTAATNAEVRMAGNGYDRQATATTYYVDTTPSTWIWSESSFPGNDGTVDGFKRSSPATQSLRWGQNVIDGPQAPSIATTHRSTFFDNIANGGFSDEAQAVEHDSGGGVFQLNGSTWELVGTILAIGTFNNQPTGTAIYGNVTYFADLAVYHDQINPYLVPEPATLSLMGAVGLLLMRRRRV